MVSAAMDPQAWRAHRPSPSPSQGSLDGRLLPASAPAAATAVRRTSAFAKQTNVAAGVRTHGHCRRRPHGLGRSVGKQHLSFSGGPCRCGLARRRWAARGWGARPAAPPWAVQRSGTANNHLPRRIAVDRETTAMRRPQSVILGREAKIGMHEVPRRNRASVTKARCGPGRGCSYGCSGVLPCTALRSTPCDRGRATGTDGICEVLLPLHAALAVRSAARGTVRSARPSLRQTLQGSHRLRPTASPGADVASPGPEAQTAAIHSFIHNTQTSAAAMRRQSAAVAP